MDLERIYFSNDTNVVSPKQYDTHVQLYEGYIKKTNEINNLLATAPDRQKANSTYSYYRGLKKGQTFSLNGVILHEEYFKMIESRKFSIGETTSMLIDRFFGSFENWKQDFTACAKSARGWCITAYDQRTRRLTNYLQDAHDYGIITMAYPLIILDMYEHAYYIDYGNDKASYISKFINNLNWEVVEAKAQKIMTVL